MSHVFISSLTGCVHKVSVCIVSIVWWRFESKKAVARVTVMALLHDRARYPTTKVQVNKKN